MAKGFETDPKKMSFLEHLAELRMVLIHSLIILLLGTAASWAFSGQALEFLIGRLNLEQVQLLGPMDSFNARFKVALILGFIVGLPLVALRIWAFVVPALRAGERKVIVPSALSSSFLFLAGFGFSLFGLTPMMIELLQRFGTARMHADFTLEKVLAFTLHISFACGLLFQLPLVLGLTTLIGVTSPRMLLSKWRHAIVLIFIIAAGVTPGDGPSQIVLAVPLIVLYFASILVSWLIWRSRGAAAAVARRAAREPAGDPGIGTPIGEKHGD
jgi:sec-independent protein translocase protein TatC